MTKLFVYGIFLDEYNRTRYGMRNANYATVLGYMTVGHHIVRAVPTDIEGASLTGLLVYVPTVNLPKLDVLEAGYDRVLVKTTAVFDAFMYVEPQHILENYSTFRWTVDETTT